MSTDGSEYINPQTRVDAYGNVVTDDAQGGLTKREYFAALAMQSFLAVRNIENRSQLDVLSRNAVYQADALIKALNSVVAPDETG